MALMTPPKGGKAPKTPEKTPGKGRTPRVKKTDNDNDTDISPINTR